MAISLNLPSQLDSTVDIPAEENKIVHHRGNGGNFVRQRSKNHREPDQSPVQPGQVLYFYRQDKENQELEIRVEMGKGQKERQVEVGPRVSGSGNEGGQGRAGHPQDIVEIEPEGSPGLLQPGADKIIKIKNKDDPDR